MKSSQTSGLYGVPKMNFSKDNKQEEEEGSESASAYVSVSLKRFNRMIYITRELF